MADNSDEQNCPSSPPFSLSFPQRGARKSGNSKRGTGSWELDIYLSLNNRIVTMFLVPIPCYCNASIDLFVVSGRILWILSNIAHQSDTMWFAVGECYDMVYALNNRRNSCSPASCYLQSLFITGNYDPSWRSVNVKNFTINRYLTNTLLNKPSETWPTEKFQKGLYPLSFHQLPARFNIPALPAWHERLPAICFIIKLAFLSIMH